MRAYKREKFYDDCPVYAYGKPEIDAFTAQLTRADAETILDQMRACWAADGEPPAFSRAMLLGDGIWLKLHSFPITVDTVALPILRHAEEREDPVWDYLLLRAVEILDDTAHSG